MRNLFHIALVIFLLLTASSFLVAQTELMDDVSAVKEDSDEDLYAPDDEAAGSTSAAPSSAAAASTPGLPAQNSADLLEDLPVAGDAVRPDTALTGTNNAANAELSAIRIYSLSDRTRFEIQTSKIVDYAPERSSKNKQFTLNLANTNLGPLVSKGAIDAKEYGGPVSKVQAYESKSGSGSNARVVMNMSSMAEPSVRREGNRIIVDFFNKGYAADSSRNNSNSDIPDNFETLIALNGKQNFVGTKVNFRAKEATIPDVLQFISQVSGRNFVLVGETDKKISMNVKSVPWDQVLALVLLNADLGYQKMGNTYRVMQVTKIRQEIADSIKAQEDEDKLAPKATQLFPLSYAKTTEVIPQITKYLKPEFNENVVSDERTNSIVVTALPKNIQRIRRYIEAIDRQTPVVHIEARIIQAQKEFSRDIGINWSAIGGIKLGGGTLSIGGGVFGSSGSSSSTASSSSQTGVLSLLGGSGGAAGQFLNPNGTIQQIDTVVKFNESLGVAKELSRPSLTVLNNKKASIVDGTELTLILNTGEGQDSGTTKTVKAALSLTVTPQVTNDENILLDLVLTRDSLAPLVGNNINVNKREISTQTLIESGATVVVGGVYIKEDNKGEAGWPFVRKIPILGRLFTSSDSTIENERELLMFISPRILNRERAQVLQQSLEDAR